MLAYQAALRRLGDRVLAMLARSLELPEDFFVQFLRHAPTRRSAFCGMRRIRCTPGRTSLGAGAHTDWGAVTLLAQDELGGLEVRNVEGDWIRAAPIAGTFVVNLGDLMQRWTNGLYRSNMHRVRNNSATRDRYSMPFFYGPRPDSRIECLPTCTDAEHPPTFRHARPRNTTNEMFRRSYGYSPVKESA